MPAIIRVRYLVVHSEGHPTGRHGNVEGIRRYHTDPKDLPSGKVVWEGRTYPNRSLLPMGVRKSKGNGWADIGYHRVIEEDGSEHAGRSELIMGAGVLGFNKESLHVCVTGNGDIEEFNPAQMLTLIHLLRHWMEKYKVPLNRVLGHRECYAFPNVPNTGKTCPGRLVDMNEIRRLVAGVDSPPVFVPEIEPRTITVRRDAPAAPTVPPHLEEVRIPPREVTPVAAPAPARKRSWWQRNPLKGVNPMRAVFGRFAAAVVAVLVTFLAGTLGLEVTADTQAALTEAVTLLGVGFWGIIYALVHKLINRAINPTDAAKVPPHEPARARPSL